MGVLNYKPKLRTGTSAQKAELIALMRALALFQGKKVNFYMDSKYAFMVVHVHGAMWKEKDLLTLGQQDVKHVEEILQLLQTVNLMGKVAIMHCPGQQRYGSQMNQRNQTADKVVR